MRVWRLTTGSIFIRSGIKGCASLKSQSFEALVRYPEAEAKRSRRIPRRCRKIMHRDLIRWVPFAQPPAFPSMSWLPQPLHSWLRSENIVL